MTLRFVSSLEQKAHVEGEKSLDETERLAWSVLVFHGQVLNGGLLGYLLHQAERTPLVLRGLTEIGADEAHRILSETWALFEPHSGDLDAIIELSDQHEDELEGASDDLMPFVEDIPFLLERKYGGDQSSSGSAVRAEKGRFFRLGRLTSGGARCKCALWAPDRGDVESSHTCHPDRRTCPYLPTEQDAVLAQVDCGKRPIADCLFVEASPAIVVSPSVRSILSRAKLTEGLHQAPATVVDCRWKIEHEGYWMYYPTLKHAVFDWDASDCEYSTLRDMKFLMACSRWAYKDVPDLDLLQADQGGWLVSARLRDELMGEDLVGLDFWQAATESAS